VFSFLEQAVSVGLYTAVSDFRLQVDFSMPWCIKG